MTTTQIVMIAAGLIVVAFFAFLVYAAVVSTKVERFYEGLLQKMLEDVHRQFKQTLEIELAKGRDRHSASLTAYLASLDIMSAWQTRILISKYSSGGHAKGRYSKERITPIVERACESARIAGADAARQLSAVSSKGEFTGPISPLIEEVRNNALEAALKEL